MSPTADTRPLPPIPGGTLATLFLAGKGMSVNWAGGTFVQSIKNNAGAAVIAYDVMACIVMAYIVIWPV